MTTESSSGLPGLARQASIQERVKRAVSAGMAFLDAETGSRDWVLRINLDELDMHSLSSCIRGQVNADRPNIAPGMGMYDPNLGFDANVALYSLNPQELSFEFSCLHSEWTQRILSRRQELGEE